MMNSNTTLVKVKLNAMLSPVTLAHSNTTLVKVKSRA